MTASTDRKKKPAVSERKRQANKKNAARSTGPKTEAGKSRSRMNALTHGLRAELVVLPDEDVAAFTAERDAFFEQWKPADPTEASFVERLAAGSWRLRRCIRVEAARYTSIINGAARRFDDAARKRLDGDLALLDTEPRLAVARLMEYRPGVEQLYKRWDVIGLALSEPGAWNAVDLHHQALCRLRFQDPDAHPATLDELAEASWCLLATNNSAAASLAAWADPDGPPGETYTEAQAGRVRVILSEAAEDKLEMLRERHAELPDLETIRARVIDAQCVDVSKEGLTLMRYEGMHDRAFRANLNALIKLKKEGPGLVGGGESSDFEDETPVAPNEATEAEPEDTRQNPESRCADETAEESVDPEVAEVVEEAAAEAGEAVVEAVAPNEATVGVVAKAEPDRGVPLGPTRGVYGPPDVPCSLPIYR